MTTVLKLCIYNDCAVTVHQNMLCISHIYSAGGYMWVALFVITTAVSLLMAEQYRKNNSLQSFPAAL